MEGLNVNLLGAFSVEYEGAPLTMLQRPRMQALVAYLLLQRDQPVPRQRLAFLFWPDSTEKQARTNLRNLLHRLRTTLPDADRYLLLDANTVCWRSEAPQVLDVAVFETQLVQARAALAAGNLQYAGVCLESAISRYRGELLPELYDDWVLDARERLHAAYLSGLELWAQTTEDLREYAGAIQVGQRLLRADPLSESTYRRLMRLHALNGERATALHVYHTCVTTLARELGVEPSPITQRAYQRLLRLQETAEARSEVESPRAGPVPLVGREGEWQGLVHAWQQARAGKRQSILIWGEAGIGKTRLAEELLDRVRHQGMIALSTRSYEAEGDLAYAPIASWLRTDVLSPTLRSLADPWLVEVSRLLPELLAERPDLAAPGPMTERWQRQRFFEALARAILTETQPLLLHIDDLQWCDEESLTWLHYLLRYDRTARVLLVGTVRSEEISPGHYLNAWMLALQREGLLTEIELEPLNKAETAALAVHIAGHDLAADLRSSLYQETEGNPLFIVESVRAGFVEQHRNLQAVDYLSRVPAKVQAVIEYRLGQLTPSTRELVGVAAVIGREFSYAVLAASSGADEDALVLGLDELWYRRIVRERGGDAYDFTHDRFREVAYARVSGARRRLLHRRVAETLESRVQRGQAVYPAALLAHHYLNAGDVDVAVVHLLAAGDQARSLYANVEAEGFYRAAIEILQEKEEHELAAKTLLKLGLVHTAAFQPQQAQQAYDRAFALWSTGGERPVTGLAARVGASLRMAVGEPATLDPGRADDSDSYFVQYQLFDGLVTSDADYNIVPAMAERWEVFEGGARYLFHLRENARWSDGAPVRAHDFVYAWQRNLAPATQSPAAQLLGDLRHARAFMAGEISDPGQVGVRALDDHVLEICLEGPTAYLLHLLAHPIAFPQPRWTIEAHGQAWTEPGNFVCNGAFNLAEREPGTRLLLKRNPAYTGRFPGNADQVELLVFSKWRLALEAYASDAVDLIDMAAADARSMAIARTFYNEDMVFAPLLNTNYLIFRVDRPPFDDVRVRQGFVHATDRRAIGPGQLIQGNVPATGGFVPPWMPGHSADIGLAFDPERGRRLLAEAGFPDGGDFPSITFLHTHGLCDESFIPFLQGQWRQNLGIDVTVTTLPWRAFQSRIRTEPPNLMLAGWIADYPDPDNFLRMVFHSGRGLNESGWRHARLDALLDEAARVTDQTRRMELYEEADRILTTEATIIMPLSYGRGAVLLKPWLSHASKQRVPTRYLKELSVEIARVPTDRSVLS